MGERATTKMEQNRQQRCFWRCPLVAALLQDQRTGHDLAHFLGCGAHRPGSRKGQRYSVAEQGDADVRACTRAVVEGYLPSNGIDDLVTLEARYGGSATDERLAANSDLARFSA